MALSDFIQTALKASLDGQSTGDIDVNMGSGGTAPLVYPRELPAQVGKSKDNIREDDTVDTQYIDYLRIQIFKTQGAGGANPYTWVGDGASGTQPFQGRSEQNNLFKSIYLYLPPNLNEQYGANYETTTLGAAGAGLAGEAAKLAQGGSVTIEDATDTLQKMAGTAKPQFLMNAAATALGAVNSAVGSDGSISGDELSAITTKKIFNPYQEVTFRGVQYRSHNFTFKMAPRNIKEAQECYRIVSTLRERMLPTYSAGTKDEFPGSAGNFVGSGVGSIGGARYLNIPDIFRLAIVRVEATETEEGNFSAIRPAGISKLVRYPTKLVLSDLKIDAAGDGQGYISLKNLADTFHDYGPVSMNLELTFKETQFVTREMVQDKPQVFTQGPSTNA
jgi:hypothetical protein